LPELPRPNPEDTKSPSLSRSRGSARPGRQSITFDADAPAATVFSRVLSLFYRRPRLDLPRFAIERSADDARLSHGEPEKATALAGADVTSSRGIQEREPPFDRSAGSRSGTRLAIAGAYAREFIDRRLAPRRILRARSSLLSVFPFRIRFYERGTIERTPIRTSTAPTRSYRGFLSTSLSLPRCFQSSFEYVSGRCAAPRRDER